MVLHRPSLRYINELRAENNDLGPNSGPIAALGGKDGLAVRVHRHAARSDGAEAREERRPADAFDWTDAVRISAQGWVEALRSGRWQGDHFTANAEPSHLRCPVAHRRTTARTHRFDLREIQSSLLAQHARETPKIRPLRPLQPTSRPPSPVCHRVPTRNGPVLVPNKSLPRILSS